MQVSSENSREEDATDDAALCSPRVADVKFVTHGSHYTATISGSKSTTNTNIHLTYLILHMASSRQTPLSTT